MSNQRTLSSQYRNAVNKAWDTLLRVSGVSVLPVSLYDAIFGSSATDVYGLNVSTTGNDAGSGDSANPFSTVATAISSLPKTIQSNSTLTLGAGSLDQLTVNGFAGAGSLVISGTYTNTAVTTGVNTGLAGSGTNTTTIVKPTAVANWTSSNLL